MQNDSDLLRILDVSNLKAPMEVGLYEMPEEITIWDLAVAGDYAYIADDEGLRILDISNPATPAEASFYGTSGPAWGVTVTRNHSYVAAGPSGLRIVKVSNPVAPMEVGFYTTPGNAWGAVVAADDYVYVAVGGYGLLILRFVPLAPASIPVTGGNLASPFDQTAYTFTAGTFTDIVTVTHALRFPGDAPATGNLIGIGHFFEVSAVYSGTGQLAQPAQPYTVTVQYTEAEKGPAIEDTLALYRWSSAQWVREPTSSVDIAHNTVTATPDRFGLWAVLGETRRLFLPVSFKDD
jgi:hypothetical protein